MRKMPLSSKYLCLSGVYVEKPSHQLRRELQRVVVLQKTLPSVELSPFFPVKLREEECLPPARLLDHGLWHPNPKQTHTC